MSPTFSSYKHYQHNLSMSFVRDGGFFAPEAGQCYSSNMCLRSHFEDAAEATSMMANATLNEETIITGIGIGMPPPPPLPIP